MVATSTLKMSSPTALWSLLNQIQMLILLVLVDTYIPVDVVQTIVNQDFALFNFDFIPISDIPGVNALTKWMNFEQENDILFDVGMEYRSTFNNTSTAIFTLVAA